MDTPIYAGYRTSDGPVVVARRSNVETPLPNLGLFGTGRFDWGRGGNGPKDLARSIVGHYLDVDEPCRRFSAAVWHEITSRLRDGPWTIGAGALNETFRNIAPGRWSVPLGRTVATAAIDAELCSAESGRAFVELCLVRHKHGDWGCLDSDDVEANRDALFTGARILSVYPLPHYLTCPGVSAGKLYVITDAADDNGHRLATTVCYPYEY